jgi:hypothetical protein
VLFRSKVNHLLRDWSRRTENLAFRDHTIQWLDCSSHIVISAAHLQHQMIHALDKSSRVIELTTLCQQGLVE